MPADFYIWGVVILILLAVSDLIVGVSNDAVNFLNSAIGSKVATRRVIMIVASCGILIGATFSSGMMEVARKGIFNPSYFNFADIMIVFLAVMLTDILLLDLFNTFGMPTSTTVSIVFELLGAAVAVAFWKVLSQGDGISAIGQYINASSTIAIISGIFLSVSIAFAVGAFVQWLSRIIFSFDYIKRMPWVGGVWAGAALACLSYFLLFKGMKGASFMPKDAANWIAANTVMLLGISFVFWTVIMQVLISVFKVNVLRLVVLFGTFSLAMAFAGNDLVNFIGVPLAGLSSYQTWAASGQAPEALQMTALGEPVRTDTYMLIIAGVIMIVTLWFSKKARSVTETEVNLGRQDEASERFRSNWLARRIVWYSRKAASGIGAVLPNDWTDKAESRFAPLKESENIAPEDQPAFDLVRASVNLTAASSLIALATSLKLPLSTTYVSFMVAMGTSLADRAWGRGSAVFRVAGVLNVIGGWFLTAIIAFTAAATFATFIRFMGMAGVLILLATAAYLITRTFILHKRKEAAKKAAQPKGSADELTAQHLIEESSTNVAELIKEVANAYTLSIAGVISEDPGQFKEARASLQKMKNRNEALQTHLFRVMKRNRDESADASRLYLLVYDLEQDMLQSATQLIDSCTAYVQNSLPSLAPGQQDRLKKSSKDLDAYFREIAKGIEEGKFEKTEELDARKRQLFDDLEEALNDQIIGVKEDRYGLRNSNFFFGLELETKDLIAVSARFAKLYNRMQLVMKKERDRLL